MPALEQMDRRTEIVLWRFLERDTYGDPILADREAICVRWVQRRREALDPQGNKILTEVSLVVDQEIPIGSIVWRGNLDDFADSSFNTFYEIVTESVADDLKGRNTRRELGLIRYSGTLPTVGTGTA